MICSKSACALAFCLAAGCATTTLPTRGVVDERAVAFVASPDDARTIATLRAIPDDAFAAHRFVAADGTALPYRLRAPEPSLLQSRYPLLLVLHGSDAIGTDNHAQLGAFAKSWAEPAIAKRFAAYVVVPQAPSRTAVYFDARDGLRATRPGASLAAVLALVDDLVARLPQVDRSRVYVVGFSMGASAALDAMVLRPGLFAGAVAVAGVSPERERAASVVHVPVMLIHGTRDDENPFGSDHAWAEALAQANGHPIFVRYEGMDHRVPPDLLLADRWREWLFSQRRTR
jgi:predicted peptidase